MQHFLDSPGDINITWTVSPPDSCFFQPENLTCTADANPPAEFIWQDLSNNYTASGAVILITHGGLYQCFAYNVFRNQTHWNSMTTITETCCMYTLSRA